METKSTDAPIGGQHKKIWTILTSFEGGLGSVSTPMFKAKKSVLFYSDAKPISKPVPKVSLQGDNKFRGAAEINL